MKKFFVPIALGTLAAVLFIGCAPGSQPTAPSGDYPGFPGGLPSQLQPGVTASQVPEIADLVAAGSLEDLVMNPYAGLAVKPDGSPLRMRYSTYWMGVNFLVNLTGITESYCNRAGADFAWFDPEEDIQSEIAFVEDLVATDGTDYILILPVSEADSGAALLKAQQAGIPVFYWDRPTRVPGSVTSGVLRDFAGETSDGSNVCGQWFVDKAEELGINMKILEIWGIRALDIEQNKHKGFRRPLDARPDIIEVVESMDSGFSDEVSADIVIDRLTADPDINAVYHHGGGGTGAIAGLRAIGKLLPSDDPEHIWTCLNDADQVTVQEVIAGNVDAAGSHQPWDQADGMVRQAFLHFAGYDIPMRVDIPMIIIDTTNYTTAKVFGGPAAFPLMPEEQWDLWPVLDPSRGKAPDYQPFFLSNGNPWINPTVAMRQENIGY